MELTKEEKREIGKPSMPRHEIDILAYKPAQSELMWVECKSYLDSTGKFSYAYEGFFDNSWLVDKSQMFTYFEEPIV